MSDQRAVKLAGREAQVLACAARGMTDKEIAVELQISQDTVGTYWRRILLRFNSSSRTEVVARAIETEVGERLHLAESENEELKKEVEERVFAEARELSQKNLLEAITDASLEFISNAGNVRQIFEGLLQKMLSLTMSEYGFIGEVLFENGTPYLKSHALSNIAWNYETKRLYEENIGSGFEFRNLNTLFGHVMTTREIVIANDAPSDHRAGGTPQGHPPLDAFLGVPLFKGKEFIGMVGIANRPQGYDLGFVEYLQPFFATCATLITAYRSERERIEAERNHAVSSERFKVLLDNIKSGVIVEDEKRKVIFANEALCRIFDLPLRPSELLGNDCGELAEGAASAMKDPPHFRARLQQILAARIPVHDEVLELANGKRVIRDFSPIEVEDSIRGYLWYYREIARNTDD